MRRSISKCGRGRALRLGFCSAALAAGIAVVYLSRHPFSLQAEAPGSIARLDVQGRLRSFLAVGTGDLQQMDIAEANLLCAKGLPGAGGLKAAESMAILDSWAGRVGSETERHFHKFRRAPAEYNDSEAYFRMLVMVTVLQQDFGVRYNPERIQTPDFSDSRDLFLHGLLCPTRQGTCVSIPVLYVAIGRRLGYPLKLVSTKAHLFARWEAPDGKERLNLEATSRGLNCFPDEYYHTWPLPLSAAEVASGDYLKSMTPAEELAVFLSTRGHCLQKAGRLAEAQLAYAQAHQLVPASPLYLGFLAGAVRQEMPAWDRVRIDLGEPDAFTARKSNN